ncbi:PD-(D/E)XK nuclease family protein [Paenibacillus cremeus]|uniref:PD-(D/E)XK nuclease family protein n=1 Tax=Paenibacillus cremeus TaxID=2163881 RepID=A0A559K891_9BACL|nr:PD-(D/E)XK nuclease family protein [Paenibacillus cremeus]TVY08351.1 hypothetical protein FPZ49_19080 [Paenibacillus cremeus]
MNIFFALSLSEVNLSSMFAYLLDKRSDHGLGDSVLVNFIEIIEKRIGESLNKSEYVFKILKEVPYVISGFKRIVDIEIRITENGIEKYRIAIENKIQSNSADKDQFKEEYEGIKRNVQNDVKIVMVFLTPVKDKGSKLKEEFNTLKDSLLGTDKKLWIRWNDSISTMQRIANSVKKAGEVMKANEAKKAIEESGAVEMHSIVDILQDIIDHGSMSECVKTTLENFILYIKKTMSYGELPLYDKKIQPEIQQTAIVIVSRKSYSINRLKSRAIVIVENKSGSKVDNVLGMLKNIIEQLELDVATDYKNGKPKDTFTLGREVLKALTGSARQNGRWIAALQLLEETNDYLRY